MAASRLAFAADDPAPPLTRAQVRAELAEAQRTGDIIYGLNGEKLNELFPDRYPTRPAAAAARPAEARGNAQRTAQKAGTPAAAPAAAR
ncbi:MAG TPA: DUF4148 domain-containing protein [Telluria sp.]|nr:DUF4148 domain-containing protein [Telluria sp.]